MATSTTTYLAIGGLGILAYFMWKKSQDTAVAAAPVGPMTPANPTGLPPATGVLAPGIVNAPIPSQGLPIMSQTPSVPNGIPANVYSTVQGWAQTDGRAPVLAMAAAAIPSEYAGMYDIITNYWDQKITPGPTQLTFWNALRAKYDPGPPPDQIW